MDRIKIIPFSYNSKKYYSTNTGCLAGKELLKTLKAVISEQYKAKDDIYSKSYHSAA